MALGMAALRIGKIINSFGKKGHLKKENLVDRNTEILRHLLLICK